MNNKEREERGRLLPSRASMTTALNEHSDPLANGFTRNLTAQDTAPFHAWDSPYPERSPDP